MGSVIGQLEIQLLANIARLQSDLDKATRSVDGAMNRISKSVSSAQNLLLGLGVGVTFAALSGQVNKAIDTLARLDDVAQKTGSSVENLSKLQKIAVQFGQDFGAVDVAIGKLAKGLAGIDDAGGKTTKALNAIGISQQFVKNNDPSQVFVEVAKRLQDYKDGAGKAALATDLFGKSGVELLPYMNDAAGAIDKVTGSSAESAAKAAKFKDDLGALEVKFSELVTTITTSMLPVLDKFITKVNQILKFRSAFSSVGGIEEKDYDKEIAKREKDFIDLKKTRDALSKPTTANKINDFIFGDVRDLNDQLTILQDETAALKDLKSARDALKASPYVSPNEAPKVLDYKGAEAEAKLAAEREAARKAAAAEAKIRNKAEQDAIKKLAEEREKYSVQERKDWLQEQTFEYDTQVKNEKDIYEGKLKNMELLSRASDERFAEESRQQEELLREQKRANDDFSRSLTDALFRGFESGKSFLKNFRDTVINAFQTLILRPRIEALVSASGLGAVFSPEALASGGSGGGITGLFSSFKDGLNSINGNIVGSIEKLGTFLSTGNGGLGDTIGGFLGQNASAISSALAYSGAALSLLKGDLKGAAFQGAGAFIGNLVAPGIGGAIGSFLGGAIGGLFGGKKIPLVGSQASGNFNGTEYSGGTAKLGKKDIGLQSSLADINKSFTTSLGTLLKEFDLNSNVYAGSAFRTRTNVRGFFDSNFDGGSVSFGEKYGKAKGDNAKNGFQQYIDKVLGSTLVEAIQKSKLSDGIKSLFDGLTDKAVVATMIQASINLANTSKTLASQLNFTADTAAQTAKQTGLAGQALADYVNKIASFSVALQSPAQQLLSAKDSLTTSFQSTLGTVVTDTYQEQVARQVLDGTKKGLEAGGGISSVVKGFLTGGTTNNLFGLLKTPKAIETYTTVYDTVTKTVDRIVLSLQNLPQSVTEFDALLKSIDKTREAGQGMFNTLFAMRDQFIQYIQAIDGIKKGVSDTIFSLETPQEQLAQNQAKLNAEFAKFNLAVPKSAQQLIAIGKGIDYTTESGLNLAIAFPTLVDAFKVVNQQAEALASTLNQLDMNSFRTFTDFVIAGSYKNAGLSIPAANMPSYDVGTSYVPSDGVAMLHRGEAVLTVSDNKSMASNTSAMVSLLNNVVSELYSLKAEMKRAADGSQRTARELEDIAGGDIVLSTRAA